MRTSSILIGYAIRKYRHAVPDNQHRYILMHVIFTVILIWSLLETTPVFAAAEQYEVSHPSYFAATEETGFLNAEIKLVVEQSRLDRLAFIRIILVNAEDTIALDLHLVTNHLPAVPLTGGEFLRNSDSFPITRLGQHDLNRMVEVDDHTMRIVGFDVRISEKTTEIGHLLFDIPPEAEIGDTQTFTIQGMLRQTSGLVSLEPASARLVLEYQPDDGSTHRILLPLLAR